MKTHVRPSLASNRRVLTLTSFLIALAALGIAGWNASAHDETRENIQEGGSKEFDLRTDVNAGGTSSARVRENYGKLPLSFEANVGQADKAYSFLARGAGYTLALSPAEIVFGLQDLTCDSSLPNTSHASFRSGVDDGTDLQAANCSPGTALLRMSLAGANGRASFEGIDELEGKVNYFTGSDAAEWHTDISTFGRVRYSGVYPGVDVVYYGNQRRLEYDFVIAPGRDARSISLTFSGADNIAVDTGTGDLLIQLGKQTVRQQAPVTYQEINGRRREIVSNYVMKKNGQVGFQVGEYDRAKPLIIDPVLVYSSYLGGAGTDTGGGIAVDSAGNAYIVGTTGSTGFPVVNPIQGTLGGGTCGTLPNTVPCSDAFVTKVNASGSALIYSTYIGGNLSETGRGIVIDASGSAYITGSTTSANFPVANAFQPTLGGGVDAFAAKLNATGSALVYSTYLGGSGTEGGTVSGIAVDPSGNAYVTGNSSSADFPTTPGAFQTSPAGGADVFVSKLNTAGSALIYSTRLGGSELDRGLEIALDSSANAYVTGDTVSPNFPTTVGAFDTTANGGADTFVTKLNSAGSALVYSTLIGGTVGDDALDIAVDTSGNAFVTGQTFSTNFPTTAGAVQTVAPGGDLDGFVTKLNASGSALIYSTYLGGNNLDYSSGVVLDAAGNAYLTGQTASTNFPTTADAYQKVLGNGTCGAGFCDDVFITKLNPTGSTIVYSTYHGGGGIDGGNEIALDPSGSVVVAGFTQSTNFPIAGAFQSTSGGGQDSFVLKISGLTPIEGDLAPRPNGNGVIQSDDVVQVQRFQIGLDAITPGSNEFLRADSAPLASRGDGAIQSNDVVQTQRFQIGLDALVSASTSQSPLESAWQSPLEVVESFFGLVRGPNAEVGLESTGKHFARDDVFRRTLRIGQQAVRTSSKEITVNILADAVGDESAYGFTLGYDPAVLSSPTVRIGTVGGSRLCNTSQSGLIACSISNFAHDLAGSATAQIGEIGSGDKKVLATVTFKIRPRSEPDLSAIRLTNVNATNDSAGVLRIR
jgi:hypothetical protein